jgi:exodeoxyribonuclease VII small subunit
MRPGNGRHGSDQVPGGVPSEYNRGHTRPSTEDGSVIMAQKTQPEITPDSLNFEQALERLEEIVHSLEDGEIGLTEALARYEQGVKLLRQSYELLERAERRIELLSGVDAEGNPITRPLDDVSTLSLDEEKGRRTRRRPTSGEPYEA